ncbi:MAG: hypothetical protein HRT69_17290 [Flavobacteriaceae bacterium]|nr:hypothetical protein [Flavobacteriaceae bacterium]
MTKKYILITLIILSFKCFSQSETKSTQECTINELKATNDFEKGKFVGNFDLIEVEFSSIDDEFEYFFEIYLYVKHSIYLDNETIELQPKKYQCYIYKMDNLIREKFGKDIYNISRKEAKDLYLKSREEKSKIIDLKKYYFQTESQPKFIGNDFLLRDFLKKYFEIINKDKSENNYEFRSFTLFVSSEGMVVNIESNTYILKKDYSKDQIIEKINTMGSFVPAYLFGIKVNSKHHVDLW